MSNPLVNGFNSMNGGGAIGNNNILQRFQQFRQMFQGDPRQQVQQLLNSGKVSQSQYNQAVQMAQQMQKMLSGK